MSLRNGGADLSPLWHLTLTPDLHALWHLTLTPDLQT